MGLISSLTGFISKAAPVVGSYFGPIGSALGSGVSSLFGGDTGQKVLGTLGSSALDLAGQYAANKYITQPNADRAYGQSQAATAYAYKKSREAYRARYQDTMKDMRKAGLNPILAASGGFNVGTPTQMQPAQSFQAHQPTYTPTTSAKSVAETAKSRQDVKQSIQVTRKALNEANHVLEQIKKTKAESRETVQRIQNLLQQHAKLVQETIKTTLSNEQMEMIMKALRGIENDLKEPIRILEHIQTGAPGNVIYNYIQSTKEFFKSVPGKVEKFITTYGDN